MPQYIDSYYLVDNRKSKSVYDFLEEYSFRRKELADDYPIPQYSSNTQNTFHSDSDLMQYLEGNPECEYIIYWENINKASEIKQFTLQYTDDGKLIFGISIAGNEPDSVQSIQLFTEVKSYLRSKSACITVQEPPPTNSVEFISFCNERYPSIEGR